MPNRSRPLERKSQGPASPGRRRIDIQIHRRKKINALSPLEIEWDVRSGNPPSGLRMASDKMKP
ncbi:MAG TPA: hypothetical protein VNK46_10255 [Nitrospiraceae bacterium]|jgi:hypothetical protein|nr:hypothetical protein [Nitrospiraceae bacterium]